jgi:hypothetical protein
MKDNILPGSEHLNGLRRASASAILVVLCAHRSCAPISVPARTLTSLRVSLRMFRLGIVRGRPWRARRCGEVEDFRTEALKPGASDS